MNDLGVPLESCAISCLKGWCNQRFCSSLHRDGHDILCNNQYTGKHPLALQCQLTLLLFLQPICEVDIV